MPLRLTPSSLGSSRYAVSTHSHSRGRVSLGSMIAAVTIPLFVWLQAVFVDPVADLRPLLAAVTTTSADLVFTGELSGDFLALDARTGAVLYRFNVGGPLNGGIITYAVNGRQFVAVNSGNASGFWRAARGSSTVFLFALPEARKTTTSQKDDTGR